jgi:hypothetical protein
MAMGEILKRESPLGSERSSCRARAICQAAWPGRGGLSAVPVLSGCHWSSRDELEIFAAIGMIGELVVAGRLCNTHRRLNPDQSGYRFLVYVSWWKGRRADCFLFSCEPGGECVASLIISCSIGYGSVVLVLGWRLHVTFTPAVEVYRFTTSVFVYVVLTICVYGIAA